MTSTTLAALSTQSTVKYYADYAVFYYEAAMYYKRRTNPFKNLRESRSSMQASWHCLILAEEKRGEIT